MYARCFADLKHVQNVEFYAPCTCLQLRKNAKNPSVAVASKGSQIRYRSSGSIVVVAQQDSNETSIWASPRISKGLVAT